ncbi:isoprenylcysteine carboxylmethyltransferase family protein [Paracoccaceae bacterium]|nr:isoprenylcysteine carboxylmethyltransferase family protein [Paracoccaceae bacterium]MDC3092580.1 isoprenylcysteine carboxylmethyltransferase family protein [Paracoccaceae bacterium]
MVLSGNKLIAIFYGLICHGIFLVAGTVMFITILTGFQFSVGPFEGYEAVAINVLLLIQFPLGHSFFLSNRGMKVLEIFAPKSFAKTLRTTVYATIASIQLILLFAFWNFSGVFIWQIETPASLFMIILNLLSWALLSISSIQAGYKVQTGSLGWTSLYKGKPPVFPDMPTRGLFSIIRQPIYLSFSLVLWTSPQMSLDLFIVALSYSLYCYFGPMLKEKRFQKIYGKAFFEYQQKVPYYMPSFFRRM